MEKELNNFVCDLNCYEPTKSGPVVCCRNCFKVRRYYLNNDNKHLWSDKYGFWSEAGCRLSRAKMPQECKKYNCKDVIWIKIWVNNKWKYIACDNIDGKVEIDFAKFRKQFQNYS